MGDDSSAILDLVTEFLLSKNLINTAETLQREWAALYGQDLSSFVSSDSRPSLFEHLETNLSESLHEAFSNSVYLNNSSGQGHKALPISFIGNLEQMSDRLQNEYDFPASFDSSFEDHTPASANYERGTVFSSLHDQMDQVGELEEGELQRSQPLNHNPLDDSLRSTEDGEGYGPDDGDASDTASEDSGYCRVLIEDIAEIIDEITIADEEEDVGEVEPEGDAEAEDDAIESGEASGEEDEEEAVKLEHKHLPSRTPSPPSSLDSSSRPSSVIENVNDLLVQHIQIQRDEFYQDTGADGSGNGFDRKHTSLSNVVTEHVPSDEGSVTLTSGESNSSLKVDEKNIPSESEDDDEKVKGKDKDKGQRTIHKMEPFVYPVHVDGVTYDCFDLKVIHVKNRTGFEATKDFPIKINSLVAGRYQILEFLDSAAFSKAIRALDLHTGVQVCMKIIKNNKDFVDQSLDEIKLIRYLNASGDPDKYNILQLYDFFYFKEHLFIVTELLRDNLYEFYKYTQEHGHPNYFTLPRLQRIARQCLVALEFIHGLNVIHTDLKPENILIKSYSRCEVKIIDFGSSCFTQDHLGTYVQSRAYRAPEVILGLPYSCKIDIWSMGCILAELFTGRVLFVNRNLPTLLARIVAIIGPFPHDMLDKGKYVPKFFTKHGALLYERDEKTGQYFYLQPKPTTLQEWLKTDDTDFVDFLLKLLTIRPEARFSAGEALQHKWLSKVYAD
jgi:hypothetical protein